MKADVAALEAKIERGVANTRMLVCPAIFKFGKQSEIGNFPSLCSAPATGLGGPAAESTA